MTNGTNIKHRCRLCYTRLKDSSYSTNHKFTPSQRCHRIVNIHKRHPESYYDFIVRYLLIDLPQKTVLDPYSQLICGVCADSLDELHRAFQIIEKTQNTLKNKYRKTCRIIQWQIHRQNASGLSRKSEEKVDLPKRQSKRKGAPKHIDQTKNHIRRPQPFLIPKNDEILTETTNHRKRFKTGANNQESYNCVNLLKTSSNPSRASPITSQSLNSVKGNQIERIVASLLSGTENQSDLTNGTDQSQTHEKTPANHVLSPFDMDNDDEQLSTGDNSNDSSSALQPLNQIKKPLGTSLSKQLASTISTTPTSEGLTITAINQTGQKQVFMAKQLGNMKKYQCGLCEKIVTNIQIHVRRHTNDKPYPCTYCEKRFTNSGDLQIHVRIHTGEKPYACPLCLKSYRTIGNFNSHVKTHDSGIRPHRCELCNQTFSIPKDWYSHLRSSHRSRIPTCSKSSLTSPNSTTTVTQPLFTNASSSRQQHSEVFVPNKVKLEPINRSQLIIRSSVNDDQEPVNMSKKENFDDDEEDEEEEEPVDDEDQEDDQHQRVNHHQSTHNLLNSVATSAVHA